jgi:hypothetical protein
LIGIFDGDKFDIELNDWYNTNFAMVIKSPVIYLQNPYKSQCSYYDTNQTPFKSISYKDCFDKCVKTHCFVKYKCVYRYYDYVIKRLDK